MVAAEQTVSRRGICVVIGSSCTMQQELFPFLGELLERVNGVKNTDILQHTDQLKTSQWELYVRVCVGFVTAQWGVTTQKLIVMLDSLTLSPCLSN